MLWLEMLSLVERRHVYALYSSPRLDSEPSLYVKAMSLFQFQVPWGQGLCLPLNGVHIASRSPWGPGQSWTQPLGTGWRAEEQQRVTCTCETPKIQVKHESFSHATSVTFDIDFSHFPRKANRKTLCFRFKPQRNK